MADVDGTWADVDGTWADGQSTPFIAGAVGLLHEKKLAGSVPTLRCNRRHAAGADSELPATSSVAAVGADGGDDDIATTDVTRSRWPKQPC